LNYHWNYFSNLLYCSQMKIKAFAIIMLILLSWCWAKPTVEINSSLISRTPQLGAEMSKIVDWEITIYQSSWEDNLDTLIISSRENYEKLSLSAYVQTSINILKTSWYVLSWEKSKKMVLQWKSTNYQWILKSYSIAQWSELLHVAELFVENGDNTISLISYASKEEKNTKKFIKQLKSLKFNF
jgi:hypothetical protein